MNYRLKKRKLNSERFDLMKSLLLSQVWSALLSQLLFFEQIEHIKPFFGFIWQSGNCRVIAACDYISLLCVSQPSANPLFKGYGFRKVGTLSLILLQKNITPNDLSIVVKPDDILFSGTHGRAEAVEVHPFALTTRAWSCLTSISTRWNCRFC